MQIKLRIKIPMRRTLKIQLKMQIKLRFKIPTRRALKYDQNED